VRQGKNEQHEENKRLYIQHQIPLKCLSQIDMLMLAGWHDNMLVLNFCANLQKKFNAGPLTFPFIPFPTNSWRIVEVIIINLPNFVSAGLYKINKKTKKKIIKKQQKKDAPLASPFARSRRSALSG
jgi:hypothetical protein